MTANSVESRYVDGDYLAATGDWHSEDALWKAGKIVALLRDHGLRPDSICDVGCGSGDVLCHLQKAFPAARLTGFDVSPQAATLWRHHSGMDLRCGDFHELNTATHDLITMLDVFEHVQNPFDFLAKTRPHARHFVFHIPLDLSALSVVRNAPLLHVRRKIGHLHLYTKDLALETLAETGFEVLEWSYTEAFASAQTHRSLAAKLASLPRRMLFAIHKDFGVRLVGGETLLVLARSCAT